MTLGFRLGWGDNNVSNLQTPTVLPAVDSKKREHGCRAIYAGLHSFCGSGLEDGHVPTFFLLLYWHAETTCLVVYEAPPHCGASAQEPVA